MEGVAHNPSFARMAKVPQSVGVHFINADKKDHIGGRISHDFKASLEHAHKRIRNRKTMHVGGKVNNTNLFRVF